MVRRLLPIVAMFAMTLTAANAATYPVKITVPIELDNVDASYTKLSVQCFLTTASVAETYDSVATAFGQPGTLTQTLDVPISSARAFKTSVSFTFNVGSTVLGTYKTYVCAMDKFISSTGSVGSINMMPASGTVPTRRVIGSLR